MVDKVCDEFEGALQLRVVSYEVITVVDNNLGTLLEIIVGKKNLLFPVLFP
jgi:hypothetical protein